MKSTVTGKILLALFSLLFALLLAEMMLRFLGYTPGFKVDQRHFAQVDSLYFLDGFEADSNGIFCISQKAGNFICNELQAKKSFWKITFISSNQSKEVYSLARDFIKLHKENYQSEFKSFLQSIHQSADATDAGFFDAVKEYADCPINANGFKSIAFKKYGTKRKSILLLGDSFTWGNSASNKTNCFADLLLTKGYVVYNTGISGTDPAQYLQVAKVLIPKLQPDYVVVNFYMGNDIAYYRREPLPDMPVFYCTNAGNLLSFSNGSYFPDAKAAYDNSFNFFSIAADGCTFNKVCSKTTLTTLLWRELARRNLVATTLPENKKQNEMMNTIPYSEPYSNIELQEIKKITEQNKGTFILTVIPALRADELFVPKNVPDLFRSLEYFVAPVSTEHYLQRVDGHYNDKGHAIHAAFIDSLCRKIPGGGPSVFGE